MRNIFYNIAMRAESKILAALSLVVGVLLWTIPKLAVIFAALIFLGTGLLVAARIACAITSTATTEPGQVEVDDQFVSIHIATYSEPPSVVKETLDSLVNLEHEHYEVIVLDNNTPDPELYEPVREYCEELGPKFRFYHYDDVKGAKAGALNISLEHADPRTDVILVLDADYQARPGILKKGLSRFTSSDIGLVQFPQAYRNSREHCGLSWEYKQFFDVYMKLANSWNTVLSTGTSAFVKKDPLIKSGSWSGDTLTEDAELGLRLHQHGYRAVYVPEVVAAGLMPTDMKSLRAQRRRWVLGNAQGLAGLAKDRTVGFGRKVMMALQLTAWANPLLFPLTTLTLGGLFALMVGGLEAKLVFTLSAMAVVTYLTGMMAYFLIATLKEDGPIGAALKAYAVHLGMAWEGAVSWCEVFVDSDKSFVRTSKFITTPKGWALVLPLLFSVLGALASIGILMHGGPFTLALGSGFFSILTLGLGTLRWTLREIRRRTLAQKKKAA